MNESEETLRQFINKIAKEQQYDDFDIIIEAVSSDGANYTSKLFKIIISDHTPEKPDLYLFAKLTILGENFREQIKIQVLDNEILFFTKLLKIFEDFEEKHDVPVHHRLTVPKLYGFYPKYLEEIMVFEDIGAAGYQSFDRFITADWGYASAAIEELAKLHALSIAYYEDNPEDFQNSLGKNKSEPSLPNELSSLFEKSINEAVTFIHDVHKDKFKQYFSKVQPAEVYENFLKPLKRPVFMHGDYRPNNLMHKMQDDGSYKIAVLDFQTFQMGCPIVDLLYFIFTCTDEEFRGKNFNKLIKHYYSQLGLALKRLNIEIEVVYPNEDFEFELKEVLPFGLYTSVIFLPFITVDPKDAPVMDDISKILIKGNALYAERLNGVINDYVKWGIL